MTTVSHMEGQTEIKENLTCPVCGRAGLVSTVKRSQLPAMQNYVYRRIDLARNAKQGRLDLAVCPGCGFAHNALFDSKLLDYDEGYDNSVPSEVMLEYYREIATYLHGSYPLDGGLVIDVGCGNGTLLKTLCGMFPATRGLGVDPSYTGPSLAVDGRVEFVTDVFSREYVRTRPSLVLCRHVLEHIPDPVSFLRSIQSSLEAFAGTPLFLEVPDTNWIIENDAFWDFCYEHCNYFTPGSLAMALQLAQCAPHATRSAYGKQYTWVEARTAPEPLAPGAALESHPQTNLAENLGRYAEREISLISRAAKQLRKVKREGWSITVWGMATKGVVFSFLMDADRTLIDFCIDVNENKWGCFVPLTGHLIEGPEVLRKEGSRPLAIVVMNLNYLSEIKDMCRTLALRPMFLDAQSNKL